MAERRTGMRAVVVSRYGGPEVLELCELAVPEPGFGQVSIDVSHAGVNYAEVMARIGRIPALKPPFTPGLEVSGRIRALGPGVQGVSIGDMVAARTGVGGYAEVALAPANATFVLGSLERRLSTQQAATLPTIVPTALALCELGRVRAGETVAVQAAAGGVGSVVVQVAHHLGAATVIGIVGSDSKRMAAKEFGYDHVILRAELVERVAELTAGVGVDVLLDSIGGSQRSGAVDVLAPLGRLVAYGNASGELEANIASGALRSANRSIVGFSITALGAAAPDKARELSLRALDLVRSERIVMPIPHEFAVDDVRVAHEQLGAGMSTGKLVLRVGS